MLSSPAPAHFVLQNHMHYAPPPLLPKIPDLNSLSHNVDTLDSELVSWQWFKSLVECETSVGKLPILFKQCFKGECWSGRVSSCGREIYAAATVRACPKLFDNEGATKYIVKRGEKFFYLGFFPQVLYQIWVTQIPYTFSFLGSGEMICFLTLRIQTWSRGSKPEI